MLISTFSSEKLKSRLEKLNKNSQLAFGAICCERLFPNYLAFVKDVEWGCLTDVRDTLDFVWAYLEGKVKNTDNIEILNLKCESAAPDSENFHSLYVTSAQDACFAICCLLDFIIKSDVNRIVQVAIYATDSVDLYIQVIENMNPNSRDLEEKILTHPLMQRELFQQEKDLRSIEENMELNSIFITQLKKSWSNNGKSNLDLPID